jgi:hypothetical protein
MKQKISLFFFKLRFLFFWVIAHSIAGMVGLGLEHLLANIPFGIVLVIIIFEIILAALKEEVFRFHQSLSLMKGIEFFAWIAAGIIVLFIDLFSSSTTSISPVPVLTLVIWSAVVSINACLIGTAKMNFPIKSVKLWINTASKYISERPLLSALGIVLTVPIAVVAFVIISVVILVYATSLILITFAPIETFQSVFQNYSPILLSKILLGATSAGWVSLLTGLIFFTFPNNADPQVEKWQRVRLFRQHSDQSENGFRKLAE